MDPKSLPTKAARDVPHEPTLRDAPHKEDERGIAHLAAQRAHLAAKAGFEETHAAAGDKANVPADGSHEHGDQRPPQRGGPGGGGSVIAGGGGYGDYYVRLTVRVEDGALSIVDSHVVEGPLAQTTAFNGPFAYEVTDGGRLLHAGSIPDLGMVRAFADMDGTPEQHRHHTYQLSTYEFDVRVPAAALREASLANVAIALHRVKAPDAIGTRANTLAEIPLASQRSDMFREVGRVVGIPAHLLTPDLQPEQPAPTDAPTRGFKQQARETKRKDEGGETSE